MNIPTDMNSTTTRIFQLTWTVLQREYSNWQEQYYNENIPTDMNSTSTRRGLLNLANLTLKLILKGSK